MSDIEEVLQQAFELGDEERWDEVIALLGDALEDAPDDPYLLCWLGVAERETGNDGAAYEYFRRCVAEEPLDPHLLALAGSGLAAFDDPEAESVLRTAVLTGPDVPMARLQYGAYLSRAGLYDAALEQLRAAGELDPDDPAIRGELGIAYALQGQTTHAVAALESALDLAPDDSWTRVLLGLLLVELGNLDEAAEQLIQAADEREDDPEAQILAALAAAAVGWEDAAQDRIARAEYAAAEEDRTLWEEADERITSGADEARALLVDSAAPSVLRERLAQPL